MFGAAITPRIFRTCATASLVMALMVSACAEVPTRPTNRRPSISSVEAFPVAIGQGDSLVVTIHATDPDGDPLLVDWFTDSRLVIKGAYGVVYEFSSRNLSQVFYRSTHPAFSESTWIHCHVRDGRGGGVSYPAIPIGILD